MLGMDPTIVRSVLLFILAGLCEIGGGYLVWLWLREDRAIWLGVVGCNLLGDGLRDVLDPRLKR